MGNRVLGKAGSGEQRLKDRLVRRPTRGCEACVDPMDGLPITDERCFRVRPWQLALVQVLQRGRRCRELGFGLVGLIRELRLGELAARGRDDDGCRDKCGEAAASDLPTLHPRHDPWLPGLKHGAGASGRERWRGRGRCSPSPRWPTTISCPFTPFVPKVYLQFRGEPECVDGRESRGDVPHCWTLRRWTLADMELEDWLPRATSRWPTWTRKTCQRRKAWGAALCAAIDEASLAFREGMACRCGKRGTSVFDGGEGPSLLARQCALGRARRARLRLLPSSARHGQPPRACCELGRLGGRKPKPASPTQPT